MLPYGKQCIEEDDIAAVVEALRGDFLTTGPKVAAFEDAFAKITQARHTVACSNGTAALHLAAMALELGPGDAVIVPSMTFLATANAVRYTGAEVIFSDVDPRTGLMTLGHMEDALMRCGDLTPRAVFPVHLAGQCVDLASLSSLAKDKGLYMVADACHAVGGEYQGKPVGACAYEDMSVFSFHPVKTIAMGEGGAISTNTPEFSERMMRLRSHGMIPQKERGPWFYEMPELGYNYRVTDIQCALGLSQLAKLGRFVARRKELVALYDKLLSDVGDVVRPPVRAMHGDPAWHLYAVRIDFDTLGIDRTTVMEKMLGQGIGTQVHYIPVHRQPYYQARYGDIHLPGADEYYGHTLSLPLFPAMKDDDVYKVVRVLSDICQVDL
ncbi:MAG: UDP-4-amino-4,6-dideoxy-N-acetyl-beta-L-altrosamine transaminase [Rhodospirillales bacterium]|nr:UDP-4-amino-4,6-dideoxy-N-acetyl-beta-L-altrosamine transaminase [Rhodospirillales bacterium]